MSVQRYDAEAVARDAAARECTRVDVYAIEKLARALDDSFPPIERTLLVPACGRVEGLVR
jgi:hypothetical protein